MRSILITVMMLIVVALLFTNVVADSDGLRYQIEQKGGSANTAITGLSAQSSSSTGQ